MGFFDNVKAKMFRWFAVLMLFVSVLAQAEAFKCKNAAGKTEYRNYPCSGSYKVDGVYAEDTNAKMNEQWLQRDQRRHAWVQSMISIDPQNGYVFRMWETSVREREKQMRNAGVTIDSPSLEQQKQKDIAVLRDMVGMLMRQRLEEEYFRIEEQQRRRQQMQAAESARQRRLAEHERLTQSLQRDAELQHQRARYEQQQRDLQLQIQQQQMECQRAGFHC